MQSSTAERRVALLLVLAQAILLAVLTALPRRTHWPVPVILRRAGYLGIAAGGCLAAAGAASLDRGLTALPLPNDRAQLRTGGLYRWVRHPIYSGLLIGAAARAAVSGNRWALVAFAALAGLLTGKSRFEERHLRAHFPGYDEYAAHTPRFIPRLRRESHPNSNGKDLPDLLR
jgi:protein-S-isoprenylcysteine O-methyltransferase Ste14